MKTYNQFYTESYSARENLQEALPALALLPLAGKALTYGFGAYQAYQAAQKLRRGDYKGAALDAALAIPSAGVAGKVGQALKLGQRGRNITTGALRTAKATAITADALRQPTAETKPESPTQPTQPVKPVQPASSTQSGGTQPVKPVQPAAKPRVLSKLKGVEGTGVGKDFVARKWTSAESDRYKRVAAANKLKATGK